MISYKFPLWVNYLHPRFSRRIRQVALALEDFCNAAWPEATGFIEIRVPTLEVSVSIRAYINLPESYFIEEASNPWMDPERYVESFEISDRPETNDGSVFPITCSISLHGKVSEETKNFLRAIGKIRLVEENNTRTRTYETLICGE